MAKVDKILTKFMGEYLNLEVHFNKKDQFFVKDCPGNIIEFGEFHNSNEKLGDLISIFNVSLIKAEAALQKTRKVILVRFSITSETISTLSDNGRSSSISCDHPLHRFVADFQRSMDGYGFTISYREAIEVIQGEEVLYYEKDSKDTTYRRGAMHVSKNETAIPYSEKSIATLDEIIKSLKKMVFDISGFFSNKERLQASLESGNLKMLTA